MTKDVVVVLRGGMHLLDAPLRFDATDSGMSGFSMVYRSHCGERAIISGGRSIGGFTVHDAGRNIYKAHVGAGLETRQLFVNGARARRARGPSKPSGFSRTGSGYSTNASMQNWKNVQDIEIVGFTEWRDFRCGVASINGNSITIKQPCWSNSQRSQWNLNEVEWVENAFELLDEEGEWYLDRPAGDVYYKPRAGEDMTTASVYAPVVEGLLSATGRFDRPVHNMKFVDLNFFHSGWLEPNSGDGYVTGQAGIHAVGGNGADSKTPGALAFHAAHDVTLQGNLFSHLGGAAVVFDSGSQQNSIIGNKFVDVSSSAMLIGDFGDNGESDSRRQNTTTTIQNNYIANVGAEYFDVAAIWTGYIWGIKISHNELFDLPYSGVSLGWGWGSPSYMKDNEVSYNHIHKFTQVLRDSAAVYSLSAQPNSSVHHNHIVQGVNDYGCLYPDEGSAFIDWHHNVCSQVRQWLHIWTGSIHDNGVHDNYTDTNSSQNNGSNNNVTNNTTVANGNWPQPATDIINAAGLEPSFQSVKNLQ